MDSQIDIGDLLLWSHDGINRYFIVVDKRYDIDLEYHGACKQWYIVWEAGGVNKEFRIPVDELNFYYKKIS